MKNKGITLIALVITIITLLIVAGISIQAITNTGIFAQAQQAKEEYKNKQSEEGQILNEFEQKLGNYQLPENTEDEPQDIGIEVELKDEWGTDAVKYIKTSDGTEATEITKVSTVYAVSVGNGETVPVPKGFYYVGGNFDTGVIISDNEADKYEKGKDKTTYEYTTSLQGNQFVWIPCSTSTYTKTSWGSQSAAWDTITPKGELSQIEKYGGFYVGRYEAGLASTITEFTTNQTHTGSNQVYNQNGTPQSKAGVIPWNFVDWTHAKANSESMYNNNYVSSGLITGTQWDTILNKMIEKSGLTTSDMTNSSSWGNYKNTSIEYTGRKAISYLSGSNWIVPPFGATSSGNTTTYTDKHGDLLTTGASDKTQKYHIFDMAGNLWEWTEETSHYSNNGQYRMTRGGCYVDTSSSFSACYRNGTPTLSWTSYGIGFRTVLYIK